MEQGLRVTADYTSLPSFFISLAKGERGEGGVLMPFVCLRSLISCLRGKFAFANLSACFFEVWLVFAKMFLFFLLLIA